MAEEVNEKAQELTILAELSDQIRQENETKKQVEIRRIRHKLDEPSRPTQVVGDSNNKIEVVTDVKAGENIEIGPDGDKAMEAASGYGVNNEETKPDKKLDTEMTDNAYRTYSSNKSGKFAENESANATNIEAKTGTQPDSASDIEDETGQYIICSSQSLHLFSYFAHLCQLMQFSLSGNTKDGETGEESDDEGTGILPGTGSSAVSL